MNSILDGKVDLENVRSLDMCVEDVWECVGNGLGGCRSVSDI
jgi:hypothetical protein